jgi:hypothetical protein
LLSYARQGFAAEGAGMAVAGGNADEVALDCRTGFTLRGFARPEQPGTSKANARLRCREG